MKDVLGRRDFCRELSSLLMVGVAGGARAIEPIRRTGKQTFKLSLAAYSLRQFLTASQGKPASLDLAGFIDYCAKLGLEGTELTAYYFPTDVTGEYLAGLKSRAQQAGLAVSGGAIGNDFCKPAGPELEAQIAQARKWIDVYAQLGAPTIRVFAGRIPKGDTEAAAIKRCIETLEAVCEYAGSRGVVLALENHGGVTATAAQMLPIVRGVRSRWFGVNFDSGNFREGDDPYAELAQIAPYAVSAQVKVEMVRRGRSEPADLGRIVRLLRDAGYSGWLSLEYEASEDPYQAIPRYTRQLQQIIRSLPG